MPIGGETAGKYPRENHGGGAIYTVDDVSDLLGIPRPTLYRYLREYSIPHLRQGGRIRIPEDSFDRIREARDLHKEGLVTETVRRQLREGGGPDTGELDRRLNKLHDTLEDLRGDLSEKPATGEVALSPALQTILARQTLMLSALFNLTGMVEDLLLNNGKNRKRPVARVEVGPVPAGPLRSELRSEERGELPAPLVAEPLTVREAPAVAPPGQDVQTSFGTLGRRRRRGALAVLSALLLGLLLIFFLPSPNEDGRTNSGGTAARDAAVQQKPPEERPAAAGADEASGEDDRTDAAGSGPEPAPEEATPTEQEGGTAPTGEKSDGGVPDISGSSLEKATRTLSEAGYGVAAIRSVRDPKEPGTVTGTEPPAGAEAKEGAPVVLTVSAGPTGVSSANAAPASASAASTATASASSAGATSAAAPSASAPPAGASASPSRRP